MPDAATAAVATPPQTPANPYETTPSDRWSARTQITADQYHRLDPADQAKYANLPGGQWVERSKLEADPADPTKAATAGDGKATVTTDGKLQVGEMLLSESDIRQLMTEAGAREARKATMPVDAAGYSLELGDFQMPAGVEFKFTPDHPVLGPLIGQAKEFAFANGIDQAGFTKMMGLYAAAQVHEAMQVKTAVAAEIGKLGPNGPARYDSVLTFLRGTIGDESAREITKFLYTANQVKGFEKLISKVTNQGAMAFRQDGREPHDTGKGPLSRLSEAEYNSLSAADRFRIAKGG
jgi:hypothetical protein